MSIRIRRSATTTRFLAASSGPSPGSLVSRTSAACGRHCCARRACQPRGLRGAINVPTAIDRAEVQRLLRDEQAQLVEVLPPDEYEDEHLPRATNIPLKTLDRDTSSSPDRQ